MITLTIPGQPPRSFTSRWAAHETLVREFRLSEMRAANALCAAVSAEMLTKDGDVLTLIHEGETEL